MIRLVLAILLLMTLGLSGAPARAADDALSGHAGPEARIAQSTGPPPLAAPRRTETGSAATSPGWWTRTQLFLRLQQQAFYKRMADALKVFRDGGVAALWSLMTLSFMYGVLHAAGPGHGKAVISAWLLANERQLRRGVLLAFLSAGFQALAAIALVSGLLLFYRAAFRSAQTIGQHLETASYALIAVLGAVMLWRAVRMVRERSAAPPAQEVSHPAGDHGPGHAAHDHAHACGADCAHGHAHLPSPKELDRDWSWRKALAISFAVGIRPCTGAILVLVFANTLGLYAAGIAATVAMALGTALTVTAIAVLAVGARSLALRFASGSDVWLGRVYGGLAIVGSLAVLLLGVGLFVASLDAPRPVI